MTASSATLSPAVPLFGDPDHWVGEHGDALLRFALLRVGDTATAEDLVQETLLAAWKARDRFDGSSTFRTWLIGILKRRIADHFRKNGRNKRLAGNDSEQFTTAGSWAENPQAWREPVRRSDAKPADQGAEEQEFWGVVTECTSSLPEHLCRAFLLRTLSGEETDKVCDQEGISAKNLSVRLHRARLLMRKCLEKHWYGQS